MKFITPAVISIGLISSCNFDINEQNNSTNYDNASADTTSIRIEKSIEDVAENPTEPTAPSPQADDSFLTDEQLLNSEIFNTNDQPVVLPEINCTNQSDPFNQIVGFDTRIETKPNYHTRPFAMSMSVWAEIRNLERDNIESAYVLLPNGTRNHKSWYYLAANDSGRAETLAVYFTHFESYLPQEGINRIPTSNFCFVVKLTNGEYIAKYFDLEKPDGTDTAYDEQFIHYQDRNTIGGGQYSYAINQLEVEEATVEANILTLKVALDDDRIEKISLRAYNAAGDNIAYSELVSKDTLSQSKTHTFSLQADNFYWYIDDAVMPDINRLLITTSNIGTDRHGNDHILSEILLSYSYTLDSID